MGFIEATLPEGTLGASSIQGSIHSLYATGESTSAG